jgi:hypothetical protein
MNLTSSYLLKSKKTEQSTPPQTHTVSKNLRREYKNENFSTLCFCLTGVDLEIGGGG